MLTEKLQFGRVDEDRRRYVMVAHRNGIEISATRVGYAAAADWVNEMKRNGWSVTVMDRTY